MTSYHRLAYWLALTLTLSPRRGKPAYPRWVESPTVSGSNAPEKFSLSLGERAGGEGERSFSVNNYG